MKSINQMALAFLLFAFSLSFATPTLAASDNEIKTAFGTDLVRVVGLPILRRIKLLKLEYLDENAVQELLLKIDPVPDIKPSQIPDGSIAWLTLDERTFLFMNIRSNYIGTGSSNTLEAPNGRQVCTQMMYRKFSIIGNNWKLSPKCITESSGSTVGGLPTYPPYLQNRNYAREIGALIVSGFLHLTPSGSLIQIPSSASFPTLPQFFSRTLPNSSFQTHTQLFVRVAPISLFRPPPKFVTPPNFTFETPFNPKYRKFFVVLAKTPRWVQRYK